MRPGLAFSAPLSDHSRDLAPFGGWTLTPCPSPWKPASREGEGRQTPGFLFFYILVPVNDFLKRKAIGVALSPFSLATQERIREKGMGDEGPATNREHTSKDLESISLRRPTLFKPGRVLSGSVGICHAACRGSGAGSSRAGGRGRCCRAWSGPERVPSEEHWAAGRR